MSVQRCAFIDVGTNTVLCLIVELGGRGFKVLEDLAEIARLGQGVDATRRITEEGARRTATVLKRYLQTCDRLGVREIAAVGTSALRDAENSVEIRDRWHRDLGLSVRVISGDEEAAYSYLAVQQGLSIDAPALLVIDIGGGSAEFIRGNRSAILETVSVDLGSVRLTERFLHGDPPTAQERATMIRAIDTELAPLAARWRYQAAAWALVGIAGTFTTLAAVEKQLTRYSHSDVHGSPLTLAEVCRQIRLFSLRTLAERKKIPGLEPKRADVIIAGACLVERIMTLFESPRLIVSDQGVRYGLLYERLRG